MPDDVRLTRQMWHLLEPVHAVLYYAPEAFEEAATLGYAIDRRWPSYFAWRSSPLGEAGHHLVAATFFSFSPLMVAEYVPAVWTVAAPQRVLEARLRAVDRAFRALLGDRHDGAEMADAANLAREVAEAARTAGRPLAAANADLPWPDAPHLVLWQAATVLREQRDWTRAKHWCRSPPSVRLLSRSSRVGAGPIRIGVLPRIGWRCAAW